MAPPSPSQSVPNLHSPAGHEEKEARVGGQAVIEGVMMRGRSHWSLAVCKPDGGIHIQVEPLNTFLVRHPSWDKPIVRGIFILAESLVLGWKALSTSADIALEEETEGKGMGWLEKGISLTLAVVLAVGLFIALPTWLAPHIVGGDSPVWLWNLVEGGLRLAAFILYLLLVSLSGEMRRVFQYHGAEHQAIHLWENNYPLEPERALMQNTDHLRCGTTFILLVLVLAIFVYSFMGKPALWLRILERVAVIPLIAGASYEIIRAADKRRLPWLDAIVVPGLALQRLTTRKPDLKQAEVAISALKTLMSEEESGERE
ncbi:MAG: DUF1385 domain-containing protein [Actinomycetota bacterium]|nr:DUF1385 domain-containing protein [Actinomycetota bacterium]